MLGTEGIMARLIVDINFLCITQQSHSNNTATTKNHVTPNCMDKRMHGPIDAKEIWLICININMCIGV